MIQNDFRPGLMVKHIANLKCAGLSLFVLLFLSASVSIAGTGDNLAKPVSIEAEIDYLAMANNFLTGFFGTSPKILSIHLEEKDRKQIGKSIWGGQFEQAISQALQYAADKAIGTVPALAQLNAMGQLGRQLGDLAWMTYGPGEFDKIYNTYFKDFAKEDLSRPPDDFVKAMIEEGSATVLFGWLNQRAGKTYTSDQKVTIIWDMIRNRRNFEILCKKHHLQISACTNGKLMMLERIEAAAIAGAARQVEQDSKLSDDLAKSLLAGKKKFDRTYLPGLSWTIRFEKLQFNAFAKRIRRGLAAKNYSFISATIEVLNKTGSDLKNIQLLLKAQLEENDCLNLSTGTVNAVFFADDLDPGQISGVIRSTAVAKNIFLPADRADAAARKTGWPNWFRSAASTQIDIRNGDRKIFTAILAASNPEKFKYSRLIGHFSGGEKKRDVFGLFLRRPLREPRQQPNWRLETKHCQNQTKMPPAFDRYCNVFEPFPGIIFPASKTICRGQKTGKNIYLNQQAKGLVARCVNEEVYNWRVTRRRVGAALNMKAANCSSINKGIGWVIDTGKSRNSTHTMFRIHVTNRTGIDLPGFEINIGCMRRYAHDLALFRQTLEYSTTYRDRRERCYSDEGEEESQCWENSERAWFRQHSVPEMEGYCSIKKVRKYCDSSPWKMGLKARETKTYKVIYNGCGGIKGEFRMTGMAKTLAATYSDGVNVTHVPASEYPNPEHLGDMGQFLRYRASQKQPQIWVRNKSAQPQN